MDRRDFIESLKEDILLFVEQEYEDGYTPTRKELYNELRYSWVTGGDVGFYGSGKEAQRSCDFGTIALFLELCEQGDPFGGELNAARIFAGGPDPVIVTIRTCLLHEALCEIWEA